MKSQFFVRSGYIANYMGTGEIEYPGIGGHNPSATAISVVSDTGNSVAAMAGLGYGEALMFLTEYITYHGFSLRCLAI